MSDASVSELQDLLLPSSSTASSLYLDDDDDEGDEEKQGLDRTMAVGRTPALVRVAYAWFRRGWAWAQSALPWCPLLAVLVPSFMAQPGSSHAKTKHARSVSKVAALDGLRGVACLIVFHSHYAYAFGNCLEEATPEIRARRLMYQPYLFVLWSGIGMVDVFFFISGYVLVAKPIRLARAHDGAQALATISSAVFRRALRLYVPSMAMIMLAAAMAGMHLFDSGNAYFHAAHQGFVGPQESPPPAMGSLLTQLYDGLLDCYRLADNTIPWGKFNIMYENEGAARPRATIYDRHLWTIPVEFKCSMLIFVLLSATARVRVPWRLTVHALFFLNCFLTERFAESLFLAGMICSELDLIRHDSSRSSIGGTAPSDARWLKRRLVELAAFLIGLFLLSISPQGPDAFPSFRAILAWVPRYIREKDRFVRAIGAMLTTWPVATSTLLGPLFTNPVAAYLGQVSFALYLLHGTIIKSWWYALQPVFIHLIAPMPIADMTATQFVTLWLAGYVAVLLVLIWAADLFTRLVDQRAIALARWVEDRATVEGR